MEGAVQAFTLGLLSAASPCLLPLYPGFIAYLASTAGTLAGRRLTGLLGFAVLAGVLTAMLAVGLVLSILAIPVGSVLTILVPIVDGLLIVLGLLLLAGRNPFNRLPGVAIPIVRNPFGQAYLYGLLFGPLALPCAGPFIVSIFAISADAADAAARVGLFLIYGLGFGLPLLVLSLLAGARQQQVVRFVTSHHVAIERGSGLLLIMIGAWDLAQNWENIVFTLGL
ncbi:MAG TPA: cytochrome c biogenesis protein CcdA [Candidatus Limnocylindrales bacterium]|nr:cytochrome c biogenesis protein CcdA [Candidatus Limnocylindrales bacterium]